MNKKDLDKINLPNNLDDIIDEAINMANEDKKKNKIKGKGYKKVFKNIAAGLAIITGIGVGTTTLAYGVPIIKNAFERIQKEIWNKGDYSKYATEVNQTVSNNGVGITLSEILCDGQNLYVSYVIESKEPFKYIKYKYDPVKDYDITKEQAEKIEKMQLDYAAEAKVSFTDSELDNSGVSGLEGRFIDDHTFVGVEEYNLTSLNMKIPDEFEFTINFNTIVEEGWNIERDKDNVLEGTWNFKVPVKVDKLLSKCIEVNAINNDGIGIKEVIATPIKLKVVTNGYDREKNDYWVRVYDEKGNILRTSSGEELSSYGEYLSTIAKEGEDIKKIKVEIYKPFVDENGKDYFHDPRETILYSKEINLE
ncbi:DUF4179 domain-containing protein [Clostridium perfringens]|uniref:DUF4179 domain-containing protein n=1 Tax=Clostridium perfringens TaxID=1502 RepID=UPI0018A966D7|nr:DUF4179 domain-containing protein [Clostridium perfringens]MBI6053725.1 DUF4179 domain-containing protein [Clostridium perfringens]MCX0412736.1 DUF4179 domain-containing protein [Clostridium perfringens]MDB2051448.1 DUF4179 domain-containing protein [Clostridium perfringens]MDB2068640.1 DUF4179 domain-containing protein [Clostridium perfringens]MDH2470978.1 DUF4179 domain-containing protein [Clostridium perfringens]